MKKAATIIVAAIDKITRIAVSDPFINVSRDSNIYVSSIFKIVTVIGIQFITTEWAEFYRVTAFEANDEIVIARVAFKFLFHAFDPLL